MKEKIIELELRAEVSRQEKKALIKVLNKEGTLHSQTKRLSAMCFGNLGPKKIDIRIRITNGECEIVIKSGSFGAYDRTEVAQKIEPNQFLGMIKIFAQFGFVMKIGERETLNYVLPGNIKVSLVSAGPIVYVELEKMSSKSDLKENNKQLREIASRLKLRLLNSEKEFNALCDRLSMKVDWSFCGAKEDYIKLSKLLNNCINKKMAKKQ